MKFSQQEQKHALRNQTESIMAQYYVAMQQGCTLVFLGASPVIVSVTESSHWDGEGLPHRVQSILYHFCFVTDSEPTKEPNQKGNLT